MGIARRRRTRTEKGQIWMEDLGNRGMERRSVSGGFLQPGKKSLCAFAAPLSVIVAVECTRKVLINYLSDSDTNFLPEASF